MENEKNKDKKNRIILHYSLPPYQIQNVFPVKKKIKINNKQCRNQCPSTICTIMTNPRPFSQHMDVAWTLITFFIFFLILYFQDKSVAMQFVLCD